MQNYEHWVIIIVLRQLQYIYRTFVIRLISRRIRTTAVFPIGTKFIQACFRVVILIIRVTIIIAIAIPVVSVNVFAAGIQRQFVEAWLLIVNVIDHPVYAVFVVPVNVSV